MCCVISGVSGVPVPGRPPGHQHDFGTPAAAEQCSKQNVHVELRLVALVVTGL